MNEDAVLKFVKAAAPPWVQQLLVYASLAGMIVFGVHVIFAPELTILEKGIIEPATWSPWYFGLCCMPIIAVVQLLCFWLRPYRRQIQKVQAHVTMVERAMEALNLSRADRVNVRRAIAVKLGEAAAQSGSRTINPSVVLAAAEQEVPQLRQKLAL
jgi:hypothetical protein